MASSPVPFMTAVELAHAIRERRLSPIEAVDAFLKRVERLNPTLNAYITVCADDALKAARQAERAMAGKKRLGSLHGVPVAVKDQFFAKGIRATNGSLAFAHQIPQEDATVVRRLKEAGAILLGKLNMSEMALGGTRNHPFGTPRNPWDLARDPGSSSSGSGVAVAASLCAAALGEDTGGSVRNPAGFCGIVGLRPTYGLVSHHGIMPLCWSMDTAGPMTKTVEDCALVLGAIAGRDPKDPFTSRRPVPDYVSTLGGDIRGIRIGLIRELYHTDVLEPEVKKALDGAMAVLQELGATIEKVSVPLVPLAGPLLVANADTEGAGTYDWLLRTKANALDSATRTRLLAAALVPNQLVERARRARNLLRQQFLEALGKVDILLSPTAPFPAEKYGPLVAKFQGAEDVQRRMYLRRSYSAGYALAALPAISIPCGFTQGGLPVGLQLGGRYFDEPTILRVAYAYQQATHWHKRRPPVE